jgi:gluconolactonase
MNITRRNLLASAGASALAAAVSPPAFAAWEESARYPDPRIITLDPSFARYRIAQTSVERLYTGARWSEGPVWMGDWRCVLWSDIPNNRILRWDEATGRTSVYRQPSNNSNGHARDRQGRLVSCEHNGRRITRTEHDGSITVLIDKFDGKPLNSPNDIVVKSDDSIWFSDPSAANFDPYEGRVEKPELPTNVYRLDPKTGRATVVAGDIRPNGLAFSPDEKILYLADNNPTPRVIKAYDVVDDGTRLANPRVAVTGEDGNIFDGFRCDTFGNLWCGAGPGGDQDGVAVYNPQGKKIGRISLPERAANLCFGGVRRNRLFMAASHSLYSLYVNTQGTPGS